MKALVVAPDPSMPGGVSGYYAAVKEHLGPDTEYFIVGSRSGKSGLLALFARLVTDTARFYRAIRRGGFRLILFNPSMHEKAVLRDGILLVLAHARGVKSVVFFRGWVDETERKIRRHFLSLFRWAYFRADAIVVLASDFKARLREMGYRGPIYVETTVVPDDVFRREPARERGATSPDRDGFNILFLSRMDVEKGIEETLEAYRLIKENSPNVSLTMAGDGPEIGRAKALASRLGLQDVEFPGFVEGESKHRVYEAADVYCFPSHHEGMPNSVLEAMAYGLPVVTRPVGGIRDFFEDGRMGLITESLDPAVLAGLIERLLADPNLRVQIGRYNRDYARERFRASLVAGRLESIFEDTVGCATVA
jgi:glycosyltransferase involved in cell wall biosynthesis